MRGAPPTHTHEAVSNRETAQWNLHKRELSLKQRGISCFAWSHYVYFSVLSKSGRTCTREGVGTELGLGLEYEVLAGELHWTGA